MSFEIGDKSHEKTVELLLQEISEELTRITKLLALILDADGIEDIT